MKKQFIFLRISVPFFISFLFQEHLFSQICSGSLGDPVVNVTFGAGSNPGAALPASINNYNYHAGDCPNDGNYTIINSSNTCFSDSWLSYTEDHTPGDVNGYMMLVNASYTPGDFYVDTVKNLCGGNTYEFSAWVTNVIKSSACNGNSIKPNLVFNIETPAKVVLGTYSTGDIDATTSPVWKQYGLFFTTPAGNSTVVIRITNNAPGGCGNDLALDDITFRPCGPKVTASVVIPGGTSTVISFCKDAAHPVTINGNVGNGYSSPSLQWQESLDKGATWKDLNGATANSLIVNKTTVGTYQYRLAVAQGGSISESNCRVTSDPATVNIWDFPIAAAKSNSPVCEESPVQLEAGGGELYNWTGPNNFSSSIKDPSFPATVNSTGVYIVNVTDANGCKASASTRLSVLPKPVVSVSSDKTICSGNSTPLAANGGVSYIWFPTTGISDINSATPIATPPATTVYNVIISNADNCKDTATVTITVNESPVANAGPDKFMLKGDNIALDGSVSGGDVTISWIPPDFLSDPTIINPVTSITHDAVYTLRAVSKNGCGTDVDEVKVKVYNGIYIPKAFTPNNDGRNDTWRIDGLLAFPKAVVSVYDRFGKKVFEGNNTTVWDGNCKNQPASAGAYVYYINLKNGKPVLKGNLVLIR